MPYGVARFLFVKCHKFHISAKVAQQFYFS